MNNNEEIVTLTDENGNETKHRVIANTFDGQGRDGGAILEPID